MGHNVAQVWVHLSRENGMVNIVTKLNRSWSHVYWRKFCSQLRSFNIAILKSWGYGFKNCGIEVTLGSMISLLKFMKICHLVQKLLVGYTDGKTDSMAIS
jgi:hypothetical protein